MRLIFSPTLILIYYNHWSLSFQSYSFGFDLLFAVKIYVNFILQNHYLKTINFDLFTFIPLNIIIVKTGFDDQ